VKVDAAKGKQLFNQNCALVHSLTKKMTGPALAAVTEKHDKRVGFINWIKTALAYGFKAGECCSCGKLYNELQSGGKTPFPTFVQSGY